MGKPWGGKVNIILHHIPEDRDIEGGYEAITVVGVPYGVSVVGSDPDSPVAALNQLLDGLRVFGFTGRVEVEDTTNPGSVERYEFDVTK